MAAPVLKLVTACDACNLVASRLTKVRRRDLCNDCIYAETSSECACCGRDARGSGCAIHRDGFCEGPEVPLCEDCGGHELPTCEEIWSRIAARKAAGDGTT